MNSNRLDPETVRFVIYKGERIDAPALLAALHNGTRSVGLGMLHDLGRPMGYSDALVWLEQAGGFSVDYCNGRPIKVRAKLDSLELDEHSEDLYDRDAGPGAFAKALELARAYTPADRPGR